MEPIETNFRKLPIHCFTQLKNLNDFNNYVDGLVLIDDMLCMYDTVPRKPRFSHSEISDPLITDISPLQECFNECLLGIEATEIKNNLKTNYSMADYLYENHSIYRPEIYVFLSEVLKLYSELIHPAIYPDSTILT